jgi:hypothetical protein
MQLAVRPPISRSVQFERAVLPRLLLLLVGCRDLSSDLADVANTLTCNSLHLSRAGPHSSVQSFV